MRAVLNSCAIAGLCLLIAGCAAIGTGGGEADPTAAPDAPIAGPDDPRPKPRPGSPAAEARAARAAPDASLEPPAPSRTPDAQDDLLPQAEEGSEAAAAEPETPAPELPDNLIQKPEPPPIPAALRNQAAQCTKAKGSFVRRGETGAYTCVRPTRDANKRCDDSADCEGLCFAKSRTCAPVVPLFGCYDALEDGRVVNICVQ